MRENLICIKLGGKSYPIKCDLAVLEAIQEEYGRMAYFENKLTGLIPADEKGENGQTLYRREEPSMRAVRFVLPLMINEGIDLENAREGKHREHVSEESLREDMTDINVFELAEQLHQEFSRCFESKNRRSAGKGGGKMT